MKLRGWTGNASQVYAAANRSWSWRGSYRAERRPSHPALALITETEPYVTTARAGQYIRTGVPSLRAALTLWKFYEANSQLACLPCLGAYSNAVHYATAAHGRSINSRGPIQAAGRNV